MKKRFTLLLAFALSAPLYWTGNLQAQSDQSLLTAEENVPEILENRTRNSKHFQLPNGAVRSQITSGSFHYLDAQNKWQDIEQNVVASNQSTWSFENETHNIRSYYPTTLTGQYGVRLTDGQGEISVGINPSLVYINENSGVTQVLETAQAVSATGKNNSVTYPGVFSIADNVFLVEREQIKNNLMLNQLPAGLTATTGSLGYSETIRLPQGWSLEAQNQTISQKTTVAGGLNIVNTSAQIAFVIPTPEVYEANDQTASVSVDGNWTQTYQVEPLGGNEYRLTTLVPLSWLTQPNRNFPVVIDPTVNINGNWGGWQNNTTGIVEGNPSIYVFTGLSGGNNYRSWTKFDITSIPPGSAIIDTQLELFLNLAQSAATTETININQVSGSYGPYLSATNAVWTDFGTGTYTTFDCSSVGTYGFYDLGPTADVDVQLASAGGEFQIALDIPGASGYKRFTSNINELMVEWQPCTAVATIALSSITYPNGFNISCNNDSNGVANLVPSGGSNYTYAWQGPGSYTNTSQNLSNLGPGTYYVSVFDGGNNNCPTADSIIITEPPFMFIQGALSQQNAFNISCFGADDGTIDVTATGSTGYTYSWNGPGTFTSTSEDLTGLAPGTYNVTVTESGNMCTAENTFTILEPTALVTGAGGSLNTVCEGGNDGEATATATGGALPYSYLWDDPGAQDSVIATGLTNGVTYTVTVTDDNGCTQTSTATVDFDNPTPLVNLGTDRGYCEGSMLTLNAGPGFLGYTWNNASTGQIITVNTIGTYSVTVSDLDGCTGTDDVEVTEEYPLPTPDLGTDISTGPWDAPITLDPGTGFDQYLWNDASTDPTLEVIFSGTFSVLVTDINGCEKEDEINVDIWPNGIASTDLANSIKLYPVPSTGMVVLEMEGLNSSELAISITNIQGKTLVQKVLSSNGSLYEQFDLRDLAKGVYFMELKGKESSVTRKIILE